MTPAINLLQKQRIAHTVHSYNHDPRSASYGLEAAEKLGLAPERVFKTLLACTETGELLVAVLPVHTQLNLKALASHAGVKKAEMADPQQAQRATGYLVGGISALAQKKKLRTFLDRSAEQLTTLHISAGRRGLEVELSAADLLLLTQGQYADIANFDR
ncbi:MAG: Cys-tRNA(Pro) deacylase [Gammaproteobacteria bacterium]|nr:Cys-tRNA(Pro) deacylase [Gammaproteobacteria bacterium]